MIKYGGKKQLISGIHYNFSFDEAIIERLYEDSEKNLSYKEFKNSIYLKIARNYLRYRWLIVYLLGASPIVHESFIDSCKCPLKKIKHSEYSSLGAISHRNGKCGYKNKVDLFPSYNSVDEHLESINQYIKDELIESHKELYSQIRLKPSDTKNFKESLLNDGIKYLEYRTIDINPFEKGGISLEDLKFLEIFNVYLLLKEESTFEKWQEEADELIDTILTMKENLKTNKEDLDSCKAELAQLLKEHNVTEYTGEQGKVNFVKFEREGLIKDNVVEAVDDVNKGRVNKINYKDLTKEIRVNFINVRGVHVGD